MEGGTLDCPALLDGYLARMDAINEGAAGINAFIARAPDARDQAAQLAARRGAGHALLCGVVAVKDNIDQAGLATTAGSLALASNLAVADAPLVAKLREAGALLAGKTNLSEWANFRGYKSTSGWSSLGGQTKNGVNPAYNPCGSSSGSAAAVAAGMVSAAIGTETDGSITCPAAVNGVVGMKPTVGLVSRAAVIPVSSTQDTAGPIARTVTDAARLLAVMAGPDARDPATSAIPAGFDYDFEAQLAGASLEGLRLGMVTNLTGYDTELDAVFAQEVQRIREAGAEVVSVTLAFPATLGQDEMTTLVHEFKVGVNDYLASHARAGQPATLAELIAFNTANAASVMPYFGQEIFEQAEQTSGLSATEYVDAKARKTQFGPNVIVAAMTSKTLDALIAPTTGPAWVTNYETGDSVGGSASFVAAIAGYPHVTVPMGKVGGLPVGLSIFAGPWKDATVLKIARAYEKARR